MSGDRTQIFLDKQELKKDALQLVSDLSNEIGAIVDVDGNLWFKRADLRKYLDIKNIRHNFKDFPSDYIPPRSSICLLNECEISTRNSIRPGCKDQKN